MDSTVRRGGPRLAIVRDRPARRGIYELVETTSAFGSAGIFVVGLFSLFSRIGGAYNAYAALATGMLVWTAGEDGARRGVRSQFSSRC